MQIFGVRTFYSLFGSFRTIRFSHKAVRVRVRYRLIRRPVASVRGVIQSTFPFLKSQTIRRCASSDIGSRSKSTGVHINWYQSQSSTLGLSILLLVFVCVNSCEKKNSLGCALVLFVSILFDFRCQPAHILCFMSFWVSFCPFFVFGVICSYPIHWDCFRVIQGLSSCLTLVIFLSFFSFWVLQLKSYVKLGLESLKLGFSVIGYKVFRVQSHLGTYSRRKPEASPVDRPKLPNDRPIFTPFLRTPADRSRLRAERSEASADRSPRYSRTIARFYIFQQNVCRSIADSQPSDRPKKKNKNKNKKEYKSASKIFLSFYESIHLLECFEIGVVLSKKFRPFFCFFFPSFLYYLGKSSFKVLEVVPVVLVRKKKISESFWCIFHHRALCFSLSSSIRAYREFD